MQIIYAAPFILLSLLAFLVFQAFHSLRKYSLQALVAPVAFGFFSLAGWIAFVLISGLILKLHLGPATGAKGVAEGCAFYLLPGVVAAWAAIRGVRWAEAMLLPRWISRALVIRLVITSVACMVGGILALIWGGQRTEQSLQVTFSLAALCATISGTAVYSLTARLQRRIT